MPTPELDLESNPEFIADLRDESLTNKQIMEKWACGNGYVGDRRARLRRGEPINPAEARKASLGDADNIVTNDDGSKRFDFIRNRPVTLEDARNLIRVTGDDPDLYNISIRAIAYGDGKSSNRITAWPKSGMAAVEALKLHELYAEAKCKPKLKRPAVTRERVTVVVLADLQIGKTGRRGGTPELLARLEEKRDLLELELGERAPKRILLLDGGDGIENFESGGNPMFTNDLSLPDQLDCYATELWKFVRLAHEHAPLEVGAVPSNHTSWRKGKQTLGKPTDDFGLFVHRQVEKIAGVAGVDATWHYPDVYDESIRVDVLGTPIGLVHGSQFGPGNAVQWWEKQAFGGQAVTHADVMISAHYHSFGAGVAGTNPLTGRERFWLGAPTLDNGSDHFRLTAGRDSNPGLMIFDVTPDGFDLGSLKLL